MLKGSKRFPKYIEQHHIETRIVTLSASTKTSQLAADALNCTVAEIAKSIVFLNGDCPIIVVISGDKRVDTKKLADLIGGEVYTADADTVREKTGYVIGGVPPFPHNDEAIVLLDKSLTRFEMVWTAAGTPNSVALLQVSKLSQIVGSDFVDVST